MDDYKFEDVTFTLEEVNNILRKVRENNEKIADNIDAWGAIAEIGRIALSKGTILSKKTGDKLNFGSDFRDIMTLFKYFDL